MGYEYRNNTYRRVPFDYFNDAPARAFITTATDIARFMIAHLQGGRLAALVFVASLLYWNLLGFRF